MNTNSGYSPLHMSVDLISVRCSENSNKDCVEGSPREHSQYTFWPIAFGHSSAKSKTICKGHA